MKQCGRSFIFRDILANTFNHETFDFYLLILDSFSKYLFVYLIICFFIEKLSNSFCMSSTDSESEVIAIKKWDKKLYLHGTIVSLENIPKKSKEMITAFVHMVIALAMYTRQIQIPYRSTIAIYITIWISVC